LVLKERFLLFIGYNANDLSIKVKCLALCKRFKQAATHSIIVGHVLCLIKQPKEMKPK